MVRYDRPETSLRDQVKKLQEEKRRLEEGIEKKRRGRIEIGEIELSELLKSFDDQIEKLHTSTETGIGRTNEDHIREEIQANSNNINSLRKMCQEMEYSFPPIESLNSYKKIKNDVSKLCRISDFMYKSGVYYGTVALSSIAEAIPITLGACTTFPPETAIGLGITSVILELAFLPPLNWIIIGTIQKNRYVSTSREIYNLHDMFLNEAKKLYQE